MLDKDQTPFPCQDRVQQEIKAIVAKGIVVPEPFYKQLSNMYKQLGFRFLLKDKKEIGVAIMMMLIIMFGLMEMGQERPSSTSGYYGVIMLISPILYGLLSILPFLNSRFNSTFEVEMTCKYNLYQIAAFRMLVFSVFCFLLNTIWVLFMAVEFSAIQFVQAFMISTTSLLLFSLLFLYVLASLKSIFTKVIVMLGWIGINVLLVIFDSAYYHQMLIAVPWYIYGAIIAVTTILYVKKLKGFMQQQKRRGMIGLC